MCVQERPQTDGVKLLNEQGGCEVKHCERPQQQQKVPFYQGWLHLFEHRRASPEWNADPELESPGYCLRPWLLETKIHIHQINNHWAASFFSQRQKGSSVLTRLVLVHFPELDQLGPHKTRFCSLSWESENKNKEEEEASISRLSAAHLSLKRFYFGFDFDSYRLNSTLLIFIPVFQSAVKLCLFVSLQKRKWKFLFVHDERNCG